MLSLKVRCPHKAKGCEWEGELGSLERHLNTNSSAGECSFVYVDCPYACGERVQRRNLEEHESLNCPLRPFTCPYCNLQRVTNKELTEHWPVCEKYPLPCPNECGEERIERQHLKGHLQLCPLEEIECEFSYAGCGAQLQHRLMPAHMKEGMEAHLSLVAQVSKQDRVLIKQQAYQIKQLAAQTKQQGELIQALMMKLHMGNELVRVPPVDIVMDDFEEHKMKADTWFSPPFYTHIGGYKMCLKVYANGLDVGKGTHVSVFILVMRGEFDDHLKWPFNGNVTVKLKKNYLPHYQKTIILDEAGPFESVRKPTRELNKGIGYFKFISWNDLNAAGLQMYNRLLFCVDNIVLVVH